MPKNGTSSLSRAELDQLKASVDLAEVFRVAGVALKQQGRNLFGLCPFHPDETPSLSVNPEAQLWQCFGCRAGGDVFEFLKLHEQLDFPGQVRRVRELAGQVSPAPARKAGPVGESLPGGHSRAELLGRVAEVYAQRFAENPAGREYLKRRGLDSGLLAGPFRLGLADGKLCSMVGKGPVLEALMQLGVLNERGQEHFLGCLVVPLTHPEHEGVVGLYGRRLDEDGQGRHRVLAGPLRGVLNWQALAASKRVVLAEGVFDALALWQSGVKEASCLFGCTHLPPDLEALLGRFATQEAVLCLDGDAAGQHAFSAIGELLARRGLVVSSAALPAGSDPNSLLQSGGPEALRELVRAARLLPTKPAPSAQNQADGFTLTLDDVLYEVTPLPPFEGRLRVRLRASRGERMHVDKLDLEAHRARHTLLVQLVRLLELARPDGERHLTLVIRETERWVREHLAGAAEARAQGEKAPELTAAEREEALGFLGAPDLTARILADMEALGCVGEESGKLLVYLIGLSRKLKKPLSGIIRSQSGTGKSSLAELAEQLTPPEDVRFYSRISPTALNWVNVDLQHKFVILEEREGGKGADYQIRALQSRRKISQLVTVQDPLTGQHVADFREVLGPIAFLETTTESELNIENTTRCYEVFLDESEEQTQRILGAQRRARQVRTQDPEALAEAVRSRHHNAQRLLEQLPVSIPFVEHITFPSRWVRCRRDHDRFLGTIETLALLHQHQRERAVTEDGTVYVLADPADYRLAYSLTYGVLEATFHELSPTARELWSVAREMALRIRPDNPGMVEFTRRDLRGASGLLEHVVRAGLKELLEMEYAELVSGNNGKTMFHRLLVLEEERLTPLGCLTSPEELERRVRAG